MGFKPYPPSSIFDSPPVQAESELRSANNRGKEVLALPLPDSVFGGYGTMTYRWCGATTIATCMLLFLNEFPHATTVAKRETTNLDFFVNNRIATIMAVDTDSNKAEGTNSKYVGNEDGVKKRQPPSG
jgi:hypothetical protein